MKTKTAKQHVVKIRLAKESDVERFKIWWQHHGKAAFEAWQRRNQYNKPPMDLMNVLPGKRQSG